MKKYIDYLFWKRTWFRICFVLFPTWLVIPMLLGIFGGPDTWLRNLWCVLIAITWVVAMEDNDNVDSPENPFKDTSIAKLVSSVTGWISRNLYYVRLRLSQSWKYFRMRHFAPPGEFIKYYLDDKGGKIEFRDNTVAVRQSRKFYDYCYNVAYVEWKKTQNSQADPNFMP